MNHEPPSDEIYDAEEVPELIVPEIRKPPSVWPVFLTFIVMFGVMIGVQVVMLGGWLLWQILDGGNPAQVLNNLVDSITTPLGFVFLALGSQTVIGAAALTGAWFFREPMSSSLALGKPALSWWSYPIVIVGALGPAAFGMALATGLAELIPADQSFDKICDSLTWTTGGLFAIYIAFLPGFCEEVFFRGYMLRRLLQAWRPWQAILVSAFLFGALHMDPHQSLFTFFLGLWLGVIAWRTGSIWVCVLCHALWNGSAVAFTVATKKLGIEDETLIIPGVAAGAVVLVCFATSVWILLRRPAPLSMVALPEAPAADERFEEDRHSDDRYEDDRYENDRLAED